MGDNEKGVAEIVGVLLIFVMSLVILGYTQTNLVPGWNKNIEMQQFDRIHDDFLDIRSDIQDVYTSNIPKTSSLSMGVRYPERYMLKNPGPGASGTLTYEPVNVILKIDSTIYTYNSTRIIYKMNGISSEPELVYEYGLVIQDFGGGKFFNESAQSLISGNDINIPVLFAQGQQSVGSMMSQSLTINALSTGNYTVKYNALTTVNITLPTRYPDLWKKLTINIPGVNVTGNGSAGNIIITKNLNNLIYPAGIPSGGIYSGMITTQVPASIQLATQTGGVESGATGAQGAYSNEINAMNRVNVPNSTEIQKFVIYNLTGTNDCIDNGDFCQVIFVITGQNNNYFVVKITMNVGHPPSAAIVDIFYNPTYSKVKGGAGNGDVSLSSVQLSTGIDLTQYYNNTTANINSPNSFKVVNWENIKANEDFNIRSYALFFKLVMCDKSNPC